MGEQVTNIYVSYMNVPFSRILINLGQRNWINLSIKPLMGVPKAFGMAAHHFNTIDNIAIGFSLLVCIDQALEPKAVMQFMNQPLTEVRFENVDDKFKEILG